MSSLRYLLDRKGRHIQEAGHAAAHEAIAFLGGNGAAGAMEAAFRDEPIVDFDGDRVRLDFYTVFPNPRRFASFVGRVSQERSGCSIEGRVRLSWFGGDIVVGALLGLLSAFIGVGTAFRFLAKVATPSDQAAVIPIALLASGFCFWHVRRTADMLKSCCEQVRRLLRLAVGAA